MSSTETRRQALDLIRGAERFVLTGHVRPDGDCIGSETALARVLQALGKTVFAMSPDPVGEPFEYLTRGAPLRPFRGELPPHDVAVLLDFCDLERTGPLARPLALAPSKKLVIDHHVHEGPPWWDAAYVDTGAAATGILVARLARELGVPLDPLAAAGVFTSLVTDTGWFRHSNTDAETFAWAAELVRAGADPAAIHAALYQRHGRERPRGVGRALGRLAYHAGGRLAVVDVPPAGPGEAELADGDDVLDIVRAVGAVEVVLLLREDRSGNVRLSARSKGDFDVHALARAFGGGGHRRAAGATLRMPLAEAKQRLLAAALAQLSGGEPSGAPRAEHHAP
jgi:phosphoesterase RecJ-like protein